MSAATAKPLAASAPRGASAGPLAQVRETATALLGDGRQAEAFEFLFDAVAALQRTTRELELLVAKLRRAGRRSERVDAGQLALLLEQLAELQTSDAVLDVEAESREDAGLEHEIATAECLAEAQPAPTDASPRRLRAHWHAAGAQVERHPCAVPDAERVCPTCGWAMRSIGADVTHRLEYIPGHFVEHEYQLEKLACGSCKDRVTTAPAPAQVLERSAAGASILARVVVSKFADHLPLTRQHRIFDQTGVTIPVSTLSDWVAGVADRVEPLVGLLAARIHAAYVVRSDATGLRVLDPASPAQIEQGTMWCYVGDDRDVVFRYTPTGAGESGPWAFLQGRTGYVQADAASVFDRVFTGEVASATEVGCWAHGRRRLVALQDTDCRVAYPIQLIARLYRVERLADARNLSVPERAVLRQERAPPVLTKLQRWLTVTLAAEPPRSDLAIAAGYLVNQWTALTRFVEDGRLSLDNNLCERQLRDIAIGRRNYLFSGSHAAAARAAVLYSLLRTAVLHGVRPLDYLTDVLGQLASGTDADRLADLLPDRWLALKNGAATA